jgi:TRAP-type C4-dicarboxylate transport system substrate-binding protein
MARPWLAPSFGPVNTITEDPTMDRKNRMTGAAVAAAMAAAALTGATVGAQADKVIGGPQPVALELAVAEWAGSGLVDVFAARVDELSDGELQIDIDWEGGAEGEVPARVQAGDADLGWVFARGLNAADVHDLDALIAPFLVSDMRLLNEVIAGPIGDDMLAGLADDGLQGLALLPGVQRFFVGIGQTLASPADFEGARIAMIRTPFLDRVVESLGAEPVAIPEEDPAAYESQGIDGVITVADNLAMFPETYMTSNLVPYTVPTIVIANEDVMAELTPEQRAVLQQAAVELRDQLVTEMPDVESSAARCSMGTTVIEAADADISAIESATQAVRDSLASDPATATYIQRIEALRAELPAPSWPATCGAPSLPDADVAGIPDGTYRAIIAATPQDAVRNGVPSACDLEVADDVIALVIADGGTTVEVLVGCDDRPLEVGNVATLDYSESGDRFTPVEPGHPPGPTYAWSWDEGELTLTMEEPGVVTDPEELKIAKNLFERTFTMDAPPEADVAGIPDGTYTTEFSVTEAEAVRLGIPDDCLMSGSMKTITLALEGGRFTELQACGDGPTEVGSVGNYRIDGDQVIFSEPGYPGSTTFDWSFDDGTLSLTISETTAVEDLPIIRMLFEHEFSLESPVDVSSRIPDGTYVTAVSKEDAMRTGWHDPCALDGGDKSVTLVVEGDRFTELQRCGSAPIEVGSKGELEFDGDQVTLTGHEYPLRPTFAWSLDDGSLTLSIVEADPEELAVLQFLFEHEFELVTS